ncbi:chorismate mutase [Kaistia dalseonensis]|uniref:chorismate mutase n=1 Tax=Kaistia dalseonensis TaxID=410840 RepID=A0ABU0H4E8_9HYPH|nr:chorismate mutase [Kaistia dalseonensis]MCX5494596.1 chorismate mutase [Kaistia dalseonensis]MDQ0437176.1 chorismate mutase [Kaistia dalseonensis]
MASTEMPRTPEPGQANEADARTLAEIRATIDRLDAEMHGHLIERGRAIGTLIKVKGTSRPGAAFRPGREADMMRRLVARHQGALPLWTVEHIWREIITTFTRMQASFDVAYDAGANGDQMRDTARFLFGFTVALHRQPDALSTINHIRESGTDLGLVALEQPASAGAWWRALGRPAGPRIMALSPFIEIAGRPADHPALVIAPELADPTPPDLELFAVTMLGVDPAPVIGAAGGTVLARVHRELMVAVPRGTQLAALSARAGLDDIARVGALSRGIAVGDVAVNPVLYQRLDEAGALK